MGETLNVFIGYDSKEPIAYHVLSHSILRRASGPISITPLAIDQLKSIYTRARGPKESTEFSLTRFLVPYLSRYRGTSVFMDCDMLCLDDLYKMTREVAVPPFKPVMVVKHDYVPKTTKKFLGQVQTKYPRKNWSSFMIMDNDLCLRAGLTLNYVNEATGLDLHRFNWIDPARYTGDPIGELPLEWNWLVGEYDPNPKAKILHYTLGGPWFAEYSDCDHSKEWFAELAHMTKDMLI
jgi:hypothetical protein